MEMEKFIFIKDLNHKYLGQTLKSVREDMVTHITLAEMLDFAATLKAPTFQYILDEYSTDTDCQKHHWVAFNLIEVCQALGLCDELVFFLKLHNITAPVCDVIHKPLSCDVDNVCDVISPLCGIGEPGNTGLEQWFDKFGYKSLLTFRKNMVEVASALIEKSKNDAKAKALLDEILSLDYSV